MNKTETMVRKPDYSTPLIMGILNVTPDSFYDGGRYRTTEAILKRADTMLAEGADIIDVGAVSTRPNAKDIPESEELSIAENTIRLIHKQFPSAIISVDTWRASVAEAALTAGASIINDVSGGTFDPAMIPLVGRHNPTYCLMHTPAKPEVMQQCTQYNNLLDDILAFFTRQLERLQSAGASDVLIDPGFGFGKNLEQNYFLLQHLDAFHTLGCPILVGVSRKSMIYKLLGCTPEEALNGTTVLHTVALLHGAKVLRVHDVRSAVEVRTLCAKLHA